MQFPPVCRWRSSWQAGGIEQQIAVLPGNMESHLHQGTVSALVSSAASGGEAGSRGSLDDALVSNGIPHESCATVSCVFSVSRPPIASAQSIALNVCSTAALGRHLHAWTSDKWPYSKCEWGITDCQILPEAIVGKQ